MHAYVINLARSIDRRTHIEAQLRATQVDYDIVSAVDGRDLDLTDTRVVDPAFAAKMIDHPGVVGCALSHLEVYRRILHDGFDSAFILEDDVLLPTDLGILIDATTQHMVGAEVVLLNFQSYEPCRVTKVGATSLPSSRLLVEVVDKDQAVSGGGYLVTREVCARLVNILTPVSTPADSWGHFCERGAIDRLRCVVPMPVIQDPAMRTTMSYYRPGSRYASFREAIASSSFPVLRQALAFRRRRHLQRHAVGRSEFVEEVRS
jgi:glycosyl transferase family 25